MSKHWTENVLDEDLAKVSPAALTKARDELILSIQEVQQQLGTKDLTNAVHPDTGEPMSAGQLKAWRQQATFALVKKQASLRRVRAALAEANRRRFSDHVMGSVCPAARALLRELRRYEFPDDPKLGECIDKLAEVTEFDRFPAA